MEIKHYGKKGMKWGVRNKSRTKPLVKRLKKKNFADMSDNDLKKYTNRLNLETNYQRAIKSAKSENISKARSLLRSYNDTASSINKTVGNTKGLVSTGKDISKLYKKANSKGVSIMYDRKKKTMTQQEEIYLLHYGKKGMKWGVRKATEAVASGRTLTNHESRKIATNLVKGKKLIGGKKSKVTQKDYDDLKKAVSKLKVSQIPTDKANIGRNMMLYSLMGVPGIAGSITTARTNSANKKLRNNYVQRR